LINQTSEMSSDDDYKEVGETIRPIELVWLVIVITVTIVVIQKGIQ
jgi:hypothetical protein